MTAITGEIVTAQALELERAERKVKIDPYINVAESMEIATDGDAEEAAEYLGDLARLAKEIEDRRKELKAPVLKWGKEIDSYFKALSEPIADARKIVEPKLLTFRQERQRKIDEANARAERELAEAKAAAEREAREKAEALAAELAEAEASGDEQRARETSEALAVASEVRHIDPTPYEPMEQDSTIRAANGASTSVRKTWKATVVDPFEIPREYLSVNEKAINAAVKRGVREIPGVVIEQVESLAVRT